MKSSRGQAVVSVLFTQFGLEQFARGRVRQGVDEHDVVGQPPFGDLVLQIVDDRGKGFALLGAIFAILGLLSSLYGRRRRIWIRVTGSQVEVAGLAKNNAPGLEEEIIRFVESVQK